VSADATVAGAQGIGWAAFGAATTTATFTAFVAVARAHGVDAGAQGVGLATGVAGAWARLADAQAAQVGVRAWLALGAVAALKVLSAGWTVTAIATVTSVGAAFGAWAVRAARVAALLATTVKTTFTAGLCGAPRAARWMQGAVGATQDGVIGPRSLAALAAADPRAVVAEMLARRMLHHADDPNRRDFGLGWFRRIAALALFAARYLPPETLTPEIPA
jgi:hypothetical protein